jgi:tRNAThr (cytosine32-N3)-methyltransferase
MTQLRFKKDRLLDDNFYIRGDGTRVYFFEESTSPYPTALHPLPSRCGLMTDELEEMFSEFAIDQLVVDRRLLVNRQNLKKMYRVWFQGRFRKRKDGETDSEVEKECGIRDIKETLD